MNPTVDEVRKAQIRTLAAAGVSARDAKSLAPDGGRGFSSSHFSRGLIEDERQCLEELHSRRFDDVPVVAAWLDGTAIGTRGKKKTVMIVTGVTAEGHKVALGVGIAQWEKADDIYPLLEGIVKRGVDPGILWIADQGSGIRAALEKLTYPREPLLQGCTTHAAGNVVKSLPEEMKEKVKLRIYAAWTEKDAEIALQKLEEIAVELEEGGHEAAASSLRGSMANTVTVQRLELSGDIRRQLRSTNSQESINSGIKNNGSIGNVTRWTDEMRLRKVARQLNRLEHESWHRLAGPEQLVGLMERVIPGRHDPEAILAKLPPTMSVERLPVTMGDDERMREVATRWCDEHPDAVPIGSPEPLDALGLTGKTVTPEVLVEALRCRDPEKGTNLRTPSKISIESRDAEGNTVKEKVDGILDLEWELSASPAAMREWHEGGAARERVEAMMMEAASAAVERVTLTTEPHHGFAGVASLQRPSPESPEQPLRVAGITFAVQRGREAKLRAPATEEMLRSATARAAEDAARAVLLGDGVRVEAPPPEVTPSPHAVERAERAPVSPALVAAVRARALELAPRMVAAGREDLEAHAGRLAESHESLGAAAAEVGAWRERHWRGAAREIAAASMRSRPSSGPGRGVWGPLGRGERMVLGELHSQWLLGDAAVLSGAAAVDAETARGLHGAGGDALAGLRAPVARVQATAEALAAQHELARRDRFEAAREAGGSEAPEPALRDSRGELTAAPIDRYRSALGAERAAALARYARAVAPELRGMDEAAVRRLAEWTKGAWSDLDPRAGLRLARVERARDAALGERLTALRTVGQAEAEREHAEGRRRGAEFFDADDRATVAKKIARGHWEKLRDLEGQAAELRRVAGSPEEMIEARPEAAIHHAAFAELSRREQEREVSAPAPESAPAIEPAQAVEPIVEPIGL